MSAEFIDTNIVVYAHDKTSPTKQRLSIELFERLSINKSGRFSTQVLRRYGGSDSGARLTARRR